MVTQRVPFCPDCREPGKPIKKSFFRCPNCGAVWQEVDWELRLAREQAFREEAERRRGINSLLVIGNFICDNCGRMMKHGEKYCHNNKELVEDSCGNTVFQRGKRYCEKCSIDAGYLHFNGEEHVMMRAIKSYPPKALSFADETCTECGQHLIKLKWDYTDDTLGRFILACNNINCKRYRNPQGSIRG